MMTNAETIKNILYGIIDEMAGCPWLFARDPKRDFTRNRKLGFSTLFKFMLSMGGQSLNRELRRYFCFPGELMTKSAFVQQRDKLLPEAMSLLFHEFNDRCDGKGSQLMYGYRLLAADGSDIHVARDETADTYFDVGAGYNLLHLNVLFDVLGQTYVDMELQSSQFADERRALIKMMGRVASRGAKNLVIADRGYDSYMMFESLNRMENTDYLIRIKDSDKKQIRNLPMSPLDVDVEFDVRTTQTKEDIIAFKSGKASWIPHSDMNKKGRRIITWPFEDRCIVRVRIVRFQISEKNGRPVYETIATSLPREHFPAERIKELYGMRWGVETSFRYLKYTIGVSNLHAKKEAAVFIEIYSRIIAYNYCMRVSLGIRVKQPLNRAYKYQLNFTMASDICMEFLRCRDNGIRGPDVESDIERYVEPVRPGRVDARKVAQKVFVPFIYRVA